MRVSHLIHSSAVLAALAVAALAPGALGAQRALPSSSSVSFQAPSLPLTMPGELTPIPVPVADGAVAVRATRAPRATSRGRSVVVTPDDQKHLVGPNLAMMIVGGAGLVVGSAIGGSGGTAVAVGGAVIGLVGLYRWLR